jgi:hypothetical protein
MTITVELGEWDSNPLVSLGESSGAFNIRRQLQFPNNFISIEVSKALHKSDRKIRY